MRVGGTRSLTGQLGYGRHQPPPTLVKPIPPAQSRYSGCNAHRYVTYHVGTFKKKPARMAGFYGFPKDAKQCPGLLHLHGGGQRAFLHEVEFYARRGYACLSINWGGREMENAQDGDPNTDWRLVDPSQTNVPG